MTLNIYNAVNERRNLGSSLIYQSSAPHEADDCGTVCFVCTLSDRPHARHGQLEQSQDTSDREQQSLAGAFNQLVYRAI
jgi:hypothetical protein